MGAHRVLCVQCFQNISEKGLGINYESVVFISLPSYLLLLYLPYSVYHEDLSVLPDCSQTVSFWLPLCNQVGQMTSSDQVKAFRYRLLPSSTFFCHSSYGSRVKQGSTSLRQSGSPNHGSSVALESRCEVGIYQACHFRPLLYMASARWVLFDVISQSALSWLAKASGPYLSWNPAEAP